jgi:phosphotransferase system enzyme I (PtsI)
VRPSAASIARYERELEQARARRTQLLELRDLPTVTCDGRAIALMANIETPQDVDHALEQGAEGVGLYRTEFFYMNRQGLPSEDEQLEAYTYVAQRCGSKPVVIRTLDLGGDKFVSSIKLPREMNPFMGWRAIRFCLERTDIFKTQLRAILRASACGNVRAMFPMIATVHEVIAAKQLIEECKQELAAAKLAFNPQMPVGAMIEIPSAVLTADLLAREVDFFSVGTNDLIQYTLAIDRINEKTARMYDPFNLAVLRLIKMTVDAAHNDLCNGAAAGVRANPACLLAHRPRARKIPVAVCGEVAANPMCVFMLIGLGVDELSTAAAYIPQNRELIRTISAAEAGMVAADALLQDTSHGVRTLMQQHLPKLEFKSTHT